MRDRYEGRERGRGRRNGEHLSTLVVVEEEQKRAYFLQADKSLL